MASIFKRTKTQPIPEGATIRNYRGKRYAEWIDGRGRQRREPLNDAGDCVVIESRKWYICYTKASGERPVVAGTVDKAATERIAAKLEAQQSEYRYGSRDARAEKLGEHERAPLKRHLEAFEGFLEGRGVTAKHVDTTMSNIRSVVDACDFQTAADLDAAEVGGHIADRLKAGKSRSNANHIITAIKQFSRWLHRTGRTRTDTLAGVARLNERHDKRHKRRALTDAEVSRLLTATRNGERWHWRKASGIDPAERVIVYKLALGTGLRASEIASLTPRSFHLDDPSEAVVVVDAAYSKHRREDHQPIRGRLGGGIARLAQGQTQRQVGVSRTATEHRRKPDDSP